MHTRGILVMTPNGAMVLTGKQSLDYSGGVSAEDNYGIGGYERIMGPNGQAQYFTPDLGSACQVLMRHYDHTYILSGERFPRRAQTSDPATRNVLEAPYASKRPEDSDLTCIGDLFSDEKNGGRKHPFDIRTVMKALIDADSQPLERWHDMRDADTVVVWDAHIGGYPVALLGIESRPLPRRGPLMQQAATAPSSCSPIYQVSMARQNRCAIYSSNTGLRLAGPSPTSRGRSSFALSPDTTAGRSSFSRRR